MPGSSRTASLSALHVSPHHPKPSNGNNIHVTFTKNTPPHLKHRKIKLMINLVNDSLPDDVFKCFGRFLGDYRGSPGHMIK